MTLNHKAIKADIQKVLDLIADRHGIDVVVQQTAQNEQAAQMTVSYGVKGGRAIQAIHQPEITDSERHDFRTLHRMYGLDEYALGAVVQSPDTRHVFKLVSIKSRRPKYPLTAIDVRTKKRFKLPTEPFVRLFNLAAEERRKKIEEDVETVKGQQRGDLTEELEAQF